MGAIHIDVITALDQRSVAVNSEKLVSEYGAAGRLAGEKLAAGITSQLASVSPAAANALSGITSAFSKMGSEAGAFGVAAAAGIAGIGVAAVEATKHLYSIGETFDNVARSVEIRTGKMGSDLEAITSAIDNVALRTASSIGTIGDIGGRVSQALNVGGKSLEDLTKQIADLDRMTGENLNIRDFGKLMRANSIDAAQFGTVLDDLFTASQKTGAPVNELVESMKKLGPAVRSLGLDFGQQAALIDMFDEAGLDADSTVKGLNRAIKEATDKHLDFKTVLRDAIIQMQQFIAAGDDERAQQLGEKLFGVKGAQQFIDAVRTGKLNADELFKTIEQGGPSAQNAIEKANDSTLRWADTWTILKNRISDAFEHAGHGKEVFEGWQKILRAGADLLPGGSVAPSVPSGPAMGSKDAGNAPLGIGKGAGNAPPGGPPRVPQDVLGALSAGPKGPRLPEAPEVPYGAGYGAAPDMGETEKHYAARQRLLEEHHKLDEDQARLDQLEHTANATEAEILKAKNKILTDRGDIIKAEGELDQKEEKSLKQHGDALEQVGAKIDNDFGISKGLPGIAENLTKFLANLVAAPVFGALMGANAAVGGPTYGGKGLIGAAALGGAFGPQFTPGGGAGGGDGWNGSDFGGPATPGLGGPAAPSGDGGGGGGGGAAPGTWWGRMLGGGRGGQQPGGGPDRPGGVTAPAGAKGGGGSVAAMIYQAAIARGYSPSDAISIGAYAMGESGLNPGISGGQQGDDVVLGLFQEKGAFARSGGIDPSQRTDASSNINAYLTNLGRSKGDIYTRLRQTSGGGPIYTGGTQVMPGLESRFRAALGPGYAEGGTIHGGAADVPNVAQMQHGSPSGYGSSSSGGVPIMAHEGEHVLTKDDVNALGGQQGVYNMRAKLQGGKPMVPMPNVGGSKGPGPTQIGTMAPPSGYGSGFQVTGGGLIGVAESLPASAAAAASFGMGLYGGAIEDLPSYDDGGAYPPSTSVGAAAPAGGGGGGGKPGGAGGGGAPSGSVGGALIGIAMQEMNEAISKSGQAMGAIVGGVQQTFGAQQFAQTKLAQGGWISKLVGGLTGAQPQLPNMAGGAAKQGQGGAGLTPEQAASAQGEHPGSRAIPAGGDTHNGDVYHGEVNNYNVSKPEAPHDLETQGLARYNPQSLTGSR